MWARIFLGNPSMMAPGYTPPQIWLVASLALNCFQAGIKNYNFFPAVDYKKDHATTALTLNRCNYARNLRAVEAMLGKRLEVLRM